MLSLYPPIPTAPSSSSSNTSRPIGVTKSSGFPEIDTLFGDGWPAARLIHLMSDRIDATTRIVLSSAVSGPLH